MKKDKVEICYIDGCDKPVASAKSAGVCNRCYAFMHYWTGRSVTDKMKRVKTLEFWDRRAQQVLKPKLASVREKHS